MIFVRDIQRVTAHEYGIAPATMREPDGCTGSRSPDNARPRQVAMLLTFRLTNHSLSNIGRLFGGRDHSTVYHACKRVQRDHAFRDVLRRITLELAAA